MRCGPWLKSDAPTGEAYYRICGHRGAVARSAMVMRNPSGHPGQRWCGWARLGRERLFENFACFAKRAEAKRHADGLLRR